MTKAMRAFGYVRLSKDEEDTTSPGSQRKAIKALCEARGWALAERDIFEDVGISAFNGAHRPAFERMLSRLSEADVVVVLRLDRLTRSLSQLLKLTGVFEDAEVQLTAVDGEVDTASATGKAFYRMRGVFAQFEAESQSERMKRVARTKQEAGEWVGQVPFGWWLPPVLDGEGHPVINGKGKPKRSKYLEPKPQEQVVLVEAATRYVAGESLRKIAPALGFTHANLARILRSDRVLEALPIDLAGSLAVEMAERGRTGTSATPSLLGGIARCSICDGPLTVVATRMRGGKPWAAYACKERKHVYISQPALDRIVSEALLAEIDTDQLVKRMARRQRQPSKAMAPAAIEERLEALEIAHFEEGSIEKASYLKRRAALIDKLSEARAATEADASPDLPLELARRLPELWPTMTTPGRRQIVRALVREIRVERAVGTGAVDPSRVNILWR